jgi:hypothetical protein
MPKRALIGGKHTTGELIYVGRVNHLDFCLPAKVIPTLKICQSSYKGEEFLATDFELLVADHKKFSWEAASFGNIPPHAVSTGRINGEEVFVGRAVFNCSMVIGRVLESEKGILLPFDGEEHKLEHYEVLVYHSSRESLARRRSTLADIALGGII